MTHETNTTTGTKNGARPNRKLKQLVAELSLDKQMLQDVLRKKP